MLGAIGLPQHIDRDNALKRRRIKSIAGRLGLNTRIIDQNIQPPPSRNHLVDHRFDIIDFGHIGRRVAMRLGAKARVLADRSKALSRQLGLGFILIMIDRNGAALGCKGFGHRTANAARTTGYNRIFSVKPMPR